MRTPPDARTTHTQKKNSSACAPIRDMHLKCTYALMNTLIANTLNVRVCAYGAHTLKRERPTPVAAAAVDADAYRMHMLYV